MHLLTSLFFPRSETLDSLLALRRLKRSTAGLDLERLNAGEKKKRPKVAAAPAEGADGSVTTAEGMVEGIQGGLRAGGAGKDRIRDDACVRLPPLSRQLPRRLGRRNSSLMIWTSSFRLTVMLPPLSLASSSSRTTLPAKRTPSTLTSTCSPAFPLSFPCSFPHRFHSSFSFSDPLLPIRLAYIDAELARKRGPSDEASTTSAKALDPRDDLYKVADKYKFEDVAALEAEKKKREEDEGNVTLSASMLMGIPEVDLGIECVSPLPCSSSSLFSY
jgi:hypothetical protein